MSSPISLIRKVDAQVKSIVYILPVIVSSKQMSFSLLFAYNQPQTSVSAGVVETVDQIRTKCKSTLHFQFTHPMEKQWCRQLAHRPLVNPVLLRMQ